MSGYLLKAADAVVRFHIDWRQGYLAPGETVAADLGWSIHRDSEQGLVVTEQRHGPARSWASFAGGVPGKVYLVTSLVRTSAGRRLERTLVVRIALGRDGSH